MEKDKRLNVNERMVATTQSLEINLTVDGDKGERKRTSDSRCTFRPTLIPTLDRCTLEKDEHSTNKTKTAVRRRRETERAK